MAMLRVSTKGFPVCKPVAHLKDSEIIVTSFSLGGTTYPVIFGKQVDTVKCQKQSVSQHNSVITTDYIRMAKDNIN